MCFGEDTQDMALLEMKYVWVGMGNIDTYTLLLSCIHILYTGYTLHTQPYTMVVTRFRNIIQSQTYHTLLELLILIQVALPTRHDHGPALFSFIFIFHAFISSL